MSDLESHLLPGDTLLYKPGKRSVFGWLISLKTWHAISHCECYIGGGKSVASRDGKGVDIYPLREEGLASVYRPVMPFSLTLSLAWFLKIAKGQQYDWLGLLRFAWRAKVVPDAKDNKQFCSEFLTRWYRAGGLDPFNGEDADAIAPYQFTCSPYLQRVDVEDSDGPVAA